MFVYSFGAKDDGDQWKRATKGATSQDNLQICRAKPGMLQNQLNLPTFVNIKCLIAVGNTKKGTKEFFICFKNYYALKSSKNVKVLTSLEI